MDTFSAWGELLIGFLGIFAAFEKRRIAERTREALLELKRQNRYFGSKHPPVFKRFGYRRNPQSGKPKRNNISWDAYELKVGRQLWLLKENGESLTRIREKFQTANVINRVGNARWSIRALWTWHREYGRLLKTGELPEWARPDGPGEPPAGWSSLLVSAATISAATPPPDTTEN
jgi:hypothetical protein